MALNMAEDRGCYDSRQSSRDARPRQLAMMLMSMQQGGHEQEMDANNFFWFPFCCSPDAGAAVMARRQGTPNCHASSEGVLLGAVGMLHR